MAIHPLPWLVCATLLAGCASGPSIEVARFRGAYTTHFDGIPDDAAACAVIANFTDEPVEWVRLKMRGHTEWEGRQKRFHAYWLVRGPIEPGERIAVNLTTAPVARDFELTVHSRGVGAPRHAGRAVEHAGGCSEGWLAQTLAERAEGRTATDIAFVAIGRPETLRGSAAE